ncbi:UNKNOWN [Stylonychia lemnae]|uniref:Cyclin N-terminal domain-containing protein n=1 Tax=Stylonychia lemnae TaxID=5949 RepID=A0A078ACA8_STYLE|nr:UNKNOWN [Stylonychia lemnae]|eukprot:CDW79890.1 UNKNOWN [Stylonychia lemnae]
MLNTAWKCQVSDFSFLTSIFYFDQVNQELYLSPQTIVGSFRGIRGGTQLNQDVNQYELGLTCLYLAAKYEDLKYPYFDTLKKFFIDGLIERQLFEEADNLKNFEVLNHEALIFSLLQFDMHQPSAIRYYERLAKASCILKDSQKYLLGLYLLHIVAFYPSFGFDFSQVQIACTVIATVNKIYSLRLEVRGYITSITGITIKDIGFCSQKLLMKYIQMYKGKNDKLAKNSLIVCKFGQDLYQRISLIEPQEFLRDLTSGL